MFPRTSMHWVLFLLSLKEFVETGKAVRILTTCRWAYKMLLKGK